MYRMIRLPVFVSCALLLVSTINEVLPIPINASNGLFELTLKSSRTYENPFADVEVQVQFKSPTGQGTMVNAFWDGGDSWKVRFSPTETGKWQWRTECSDKLNKGLHEQSGRFTCTAYKGKNALVMHGPLKLSSNRRYFVHADGSPFFWLADTAWNGVLKAKPQDWEKYLSIRKSQGFTVVQFVSTPWRSFEKDLHGDAAFTGQERICVTPAFFQRLDAKVAAINDHGMVASPVILWAVSKDDLGQRLSEPDAIRLAKYITARWGAYNVVWMLGGDGNYGGDKAERWRRIGRAVFGDKPLRLATMHPGGQQWIGEEFRSEPWYSFIGYQSGHGDSDTALRWLTLGPTAREWNKQPELPVINLEPNYEGHISYDKKHVFDAEKVRRALYWSLFISPTAGVTYGHHGIWFWTDKAQVPTAHPSSGIALPWNEAVKSEGAESVRHLKAFFSTIPWWKLVPDPSLVTNQPAEPGRFMAASRTEDGKLAVIYLPEGGSVELDVGKMNRPLEAKWYNPADGKFAAVTETIGVRFKATAPNRDDWVLLIRHKD